MAPSRRLPVAESPPRPRPFREMPRPRAHPILGNLPEWLGMHKGRTVLQRLHGYALECGPLARVPLGPTSIVSVTGVDLVAELLAGEAANYKGWTYILTRAVLDNVLLRNGAAWTHGRRQYRQALQQADMLASADGRAAAVVESWRHERTARPVDLAALAHRLVGDTVAHFVAGTRIDEALDADRARIQHELAAVGMDLQCQPWAYLWPPRWTSLRASVARMRAHFATVVRARRAAGCVPTPDVLQGLLQLARRGEHDADDLAIADTLINIYFTAHDVLASSTGWCLWLLATHPDVQSRLRAELRAVGPGPRSADALLAVDHLGQVVKEALRLYPGYALFGRNPQAPLRLQGFDVPRSALLIVSPWVIHRLPRYFDDPERFDPERWRRDPHGVPPPRPEGGYLPFGAGRRACLASRLAFPTMKLLVARLIEATELTPRAGHVPRLRYCGTVVSENGLHGTLQPLT
jgi:enediyne biosynthesis protein E7